MAINLTASARLNTSAFSAGLKTIASELAAIESATKQANKNLTKTTGNNAKLAQRATSVANSQNKIAESTRAMADAQNRYNKAFAKDKVPARVNKRTAESMRNNSRIVAEAMGVESSAILSTASAMEAQSAAATEMGTAAKAAAKGVNSLAAAQERLNTAVASGAMAPTAAAKPVKGKAPKTGTAGELAAREAAAAETLRSAAIDNTNRSTKAATQAQRINTAVDKAQVAETERLVNAGKAEAATLARQSAARRAVTKAERALQRAAANEANARLGGKTGAELATFTEATRRATEGLANAQARLNSEKAKTSGIVQKEAAATQAAMTAQSQASAAAKNYSKSLSGLSNDQIKRMELTNRLASAEASLASAYQKSGGAVTSSVRKAQNQINAAQRAMNSFDEAQAAATAGGIKAAEGLTSQRYLYSDMSRTLSSAALGFAAIPAAAIAAGAAWESSFANVVRTSNLESGTAQVDDLRNSLRDLVMTMPSSWGDVTEIATLANQMGIASQDTVKFTEAVAKFSATSGVSVDEAATAFGRLNTVVEHIPGGFNALGDSILNVGVNSVATEKEIIDVTTQISSIAGQANFTADEMVGLSGALASVKVAPELSRGVITRVFGQMSRAVSSGGAALDGFAKISGMTADEFSNSWGVEGKSGDAFRSFLHGLQKLGPQAESELRSLGITSVRDVPVLLRLSTAKDSNGVVGGLIDQTFNDATLEKSRGAMQKQYDEISETVLSKLKMTGNAIMAFLDGISGSSMKTFGGLLETITDGLNNLTRSLDDNVKVFGAFELPFTNADAIGMAAGLSLTVAGVLALGSAFLKLRSVMTGMRQLGGLFFTRKMGQEVAVGAQQVNRSVLSVADRYRAFPNQIRGAMTRATSVLATGYGKMAVAADRASARINNQVMPLLAPKKQTFTKVPMLDQGAASARAAAVVSNSFSKMKAAASTAGRFISGTASFAFGPWGIAIGLAIAGIATLVEKTRAASTDPSVLAEAWAKASGDIEKSTAALKNIEVGGLFGQINKPFEDGIVTMKDLVKERDKALKKIVGDDSPGDVSQLIGKSRAAILSAEVETNKVTSKYTRDAKALEGANKVISDSFQDMVDAGNTEAAVKSLFAATDSVDNLYDVITGPGSDGLKEFFKNSFDATGVKLTRDNLGKLANGELPDTFESLTGIADMTGITADGFSNMAESMVETQKNASAVNSAFIDMKGAVAEATDGDNFSMDKFSETLQDQVDEQTRWAKNLGVAGKIGGQEFVDALLTMGPDAQEPLQAIVDDFNSTGGDAHGKWKKWMDQIVAATTTDLSALGPAMAAARESLKKSLNITDGDTTLIDSIARSLSSSQFSSISTALEGVSPKIGSKIMTSLAEGIGKADGDKAKIAAAVESALNQATFAAHPKVTAELLADPASAYLTYDTFKQVVNGTVTFAQIDALCCSIVLWM